MQCRFELSSIFLSVLQRHALGDPANWRHNQRVLSLRVDSQAGSKKANQVGQSVEPAKSVKRNDDDDDDDEHDSISCAALQGGVSELGEEERQGPRETLQHRVERRHGCKRFFAFSTRCGVAFFEFRTTRPDAGPRKTRT